jgi:hypothetical protein
MATAADIIDLAIGDYLNQSQEGDSSLSGFLATKGLARLNDMLASFPSYGIGGGFRDATYTSSFEVTEPVRVYCQGSTFTITLPEKPTEGYSIEIHNPGTITLARNGNLIAGSAADATVTEDKLFMFIEGDWKEMGALTNGSTVPFPDEFKGALAAMLAMEIGGTMGLLDPPVAVQRLASKGLSRLRARYRPRLNKQADYGIDPRQQRVDILNLDN